jgi:alkylhydroperoxidase family enzyme
MSRIAAVEPSTASAAVKPLLDGVQKGLGMTPNLFRVAAQSPAALEALVSLFGATGKGHFDARTREAIALAVSEANGCDRASPTPRWSRSSPTSRSRPSPTT